jgi:hypothetical protein
LRTVNVSVRVTAFGTVTAVPFGVTAGGAPRKRYHSSIALV